MNEQQLITSIHNKIKLRSTLVGNLYHNMVTQEIIVHNQALEKLTGKKYDEYTKREVEFAIMEHEVLT